MAEWNAQWSCGRVIKKSIPGRGSMHCMWRHLQLHQSGLRFCLGKLQCSLFTLAFSPLQDVHKASLRRLEIRRRPLNHAWFVGEAIARCYPCVIPFWCLILALELCLVVTSSDRSFLLYTTPAEQILCSCLLRGLFGGAYQECGVYFQYSGGWQLIGVSMDTVFFIWPHFVSKVVCWAVDSVQKFESQKSVRKL